MNIEAIRRFRQRLRSDQPVHGLWVTLESASITEMAVALGLDWVVIDAEHGHLDWRDILQHIRAAVRSDTVVLVRVAELNASLIKRALDIGADGVVIPMIETPQQLADAVRFAKYPPEGIRGIGAERATCWGSCFVEHTDVANDNVLVVPLVESAAGVRRIDELVRVDGVDVFFTGPADLSATMGHRGQWEGPGVADAVQTILRSVRAAGKHMGVVATSDDNLAERRREGFRMLGLGLDAGLLVRTLRQSLASTGQQRTIRAGFTPENDAAALAAEQPAVCAPQHMRPDRPELMTHPGEGPQIELWRGVTFDCMVGGHNTARNLTTGIATFRPQAKLPYHRHTFGESVTVLSGRVVLEVEGRRYTLEKLDNVTIPAGVAHEATNISVSEPAVLHVAIASDSPTRELVNTFFSRRAMPLVAHHEPNAERVIRYRTAVRYEPGDNASFIDFFNADLIPGFEMSGGYGWFDTGGRLPAHLHDFDESICIISGNATCIVEGRRYALSNRETALQPRGRIHYFINETPQPMEMIWVYAGPQPERLVVDEQCAVSDPWGDTRAEVRA